jgi:hypothetical protein
VQQAAGPRKVRLVLTFADSTVKNTWLKVDVGTGFGLAAAETHYWGNVAGDCNMGNTATNFTVSGADELAVRSHPTNSFSPSIVTDIYDVNKDHLANASDQLYIRSNGTTSFTCVKSITK